MAKLAGLIRDKEEDVVRLQTLIKVGKEEINSFRMEFSGKMKTKSKQCGKRRICALQVDAHRVDVVIRISPT